MISFGPLDPGRDLAGLRHASQAQFGPEGYQHSDRYLDWLYRANPAGRGPTDCLVARQDGAVVGCMHRMILPLAGGGLIAVLHNHFVAEEVRSGPGVLLLRRAVKDVEIGFAPGVLAPLDQVYRRLQFTEQPGHWLMRPVNRPRLAWQLARARLGGGRGPLRIDPARLDGTAGLRVTADPDAGDLERLCATMRAQASGAVSAVDWTPELVRWRYFHPSGPRYLLLTAGNGAAAVVSFGVRRGLSVARILELSAPEDLRFLATAGRVMRAAGAVLALSFTMRPEVLASLKAGGWRQRGNETYSFRMGGDALAIGPGATDVGFEAFNTEVC